MNKAGLLSLLILLQCSHPEITYSQIIKATGSLNPAIKHAESIYYNSFGGRAGLYNGPEYTGYPHKLKGGHPFFESDEVTTGIIFYEGMLYKDVPIWYDLVKNQVVIRYLDDYSRISLHNEKIKYFLLFKHLFIHITDTSNTPAIPAGFYDHIYQGKTEILVKRTKGSRRDVSPEGMFTLILKQKNDIYLKKEGTYFPVSNLASVLKILGKQQKEIRTYLKTSKVNFKKEPEKALVLMVSHYDQIQ